METSTRSIVTETGPRQLYREYSRDELEAAQGLLALFASCKCPDAQDQSDARADTISPPSAAAPNINDAPTVAQVNTDEGEEKDQQQQQTKVSRSGQRAQGLRQMRSHKKRALTMMDGQQVPPTIASMIRRRAHVPDFENWLRLKQWAQANPTPALPVNGLVELQAFHVWCIVQVRRQAQLQANHDRQLPQSTSQRSRKDPFYLKLLKHTSKTQAFSVDFHRIEQQTKTLRRERDEANQELSNMGKQLSKVQEELKNTQGQLGGLHEEVRTLQARLTETSERRDNDIETTGVHPDLL